MERLIILAKDSSQPILQECEMLLDGTQPGRTVKLVLFTVAISYYDALLYLRR